LGDVTRLRQVLANLLSNAVKFTEQGEIVVSVQRRGVTPPHLSTPAPVSDGASVELHFTVRDTGLGIPPERMARLFKPFSQLDASTTRKYGGTGLGLVISNRLITLMGGQIWAESTGMPGSGTTFHFTLPTVVAPETPLASLPTPTAFDAQLAQRFPLRLLLVEDNLVNRKLALTLLQRLGYQAEVAVNGLEALTTLQQRSYDVILMDLQMPEMDGLEATREIRRRWAIENQPRIVAMTANAMPGDRELCLQAGMDDYLSKPIQVSELRAVLERWGTAAQRTSPPFAATKVLPILDRTVLDELRAVGPGVEQELVSLFLSESQTLVQRIMTALHAQDAAAVRQAAHALKGSSASLGAKRLAAVCADLEHQGRKGQLPPVAEVEPKLLQEFENVTRLLVANRPAV
jgi:CheY-like chemotaxis protein/HPt (histidine-containing phosphotransfer) domain-containing protein